MCGAVAEGQYWCIRLTPILLIAVYTTDTARNLVYTFGAVCVELCTTAASGPTAIFAKDIMTIPGSQTIWVTAHQTIQKLP